MADKIMIIGYGSTGKYVLDMMVRLPEFADCEYTVISRSEKAEAEKRINLTLVSAGIFGMYPKIIYEQCNIEDTNRLSELIAKREPDVIAYTGRYMKGFKYGEFSYPNGIGYGVWAPMSAVLVEKVMEAVKRSSIKTKVINTSYGDAVSPLLAEKGLAPYTSAGNLNHLIPRIVHAYETLTDIRLKESDVTFVGSHYANTYISKEGTPKGSAYLMDIKGNTSIEDEKIFRLCALPTASGPDRNIMIASDVVMLTRFILDKSSAEHRIHAPGAHGKIGGYPLIFRGGQMEIDESVYSLEEMINVNKKSLMCDGIEAIDANGLRFTDEVIWQMKKVFGIIYPKTIALEDCGRFAEQIAEGIIRWKNAN